LGCWRATLEPGTSVQMKIGVLFFGLLKDVVGRSSETVELPEGARVRDVLRHCVRVAPRLEPMMPSLAISVNREYAEVTACCAKAMRSRCCRRSAAARANGRGWDGPRPIDRDAVVGRLQRPPDGAVVIFDGVVRDNTRGPPHPLLDYEAYEAMALAQMEALAAETRARFVVRAVSIIHGSGRLEIGETKRAGRGGGGAPGRGV